MKKLILSTLLMAGCLTASAQEAESEYVFNPHWYVQGQIGAQYTLGEIGFGDLLSPTIQVGVGYKFNPYVGLRLSLNAWQSKGGYDGNEFGANIGEYSWKWNYIAPNVDAIFDLSNLVLGYNPERKYDFGALVGLGVNIAWNNDEAKDAAAAVKTKNGNGPSHVWDGTAARIQGRFGIYGDYKINDEWSVGLEVDANFLNDHYNSKHAPNADWYFNAMVGVKYNLGSTYTKKAKAAPVVAPQQQVQEKVVEKVVEKIVEVEKVQPLRRDIFFLIRGSQISLGEMQKVREVAEYMKANPNSKVEITGYADKGTGNPKINATYAEKRAKMVAETLQNKYGIDASRITYSSKGDTEQPYAEKELNRVSICIAK